MKFYDSPGAPSPRRVRVFLAQRNMSVARVPVDRRARGQFAPEFRAINPDCTVPVLELDGTYLLAERGRATLARFHRKLDQQLADNVFVAGARFSVADITALVTLDVAARVEARLPEDAPQLQRGYEAVSRRPSATA